jgi:hypothetical protein
MTIFTHSHDNILPQSWQYPNQLMTIAHTPSIRHNHGSFQAHNHINIQLNKIKLDGKAQLKPSRDSIQA